MKAFVFEIPCKMLVNVEAENEIVARVLLRKRIMGARAEWSGDATTQCSLSVQIDDGEDEIVQMDADDVYEAECFEKT